MKTELLKKELETAQKVDSKMEEGKFSLYTWGVLGLNGRKAKAGRSKGRGFGISLSSMLFQARRGQKEKRRV